MFVKIGKAPDNDCIVDDLYVSRHHAILQGAAQGEYFLEDLDSANGTYVNGQKIRRKKLNATDIILLGNNYSISLSEILNSKNNYSGEFENLLSVYENYQNQKIRIQTSNQFKARLIQTLPFIFPGLLGITLGLSGIPNSGILIISIIISVAAPVTGIVIGARLVSKTPAQLYELAEQFKIDYVCPRCGTYLGEIPWQSLKNKGFCSNPNCKAQW